MGNAPCYRLWACAMEDIAKGVKFSKLSMGY